MPQFGNASKIRLATCHPLLQKVFERVVQIIDCAVVCGQRNKVDQDAAVAAGNSKTPWPTSKHNAVPFSLATDVVPFPIDWKNTKRFYLLAGIALGVAAEMGVPLRWGGDWDRDYDLDDQKFMDLPHFELVV